MSIVRDIDICSVKIASEALHGGPYGVFRAREIINAEPHYSEFRNCLAWHPGCTLTAELNWPHGRGGTAVFRLRGMWDFYKDLPGELSNGSYVMKTRAAFEIRLNSRIIFNSDIHFWNYRKWRFWPAIDLKFNAAWLRPGMNRLEMINHTRPFERTGKGKDCRYLDGIVENCVYQISDIRVLLMQRDTPHAAELPHGLYFGHLLGGHEVIYHDHEDFSLRIEEFLKARQGNLVVLMLNPEGTGYELNLNALDVEAIKKAGLKVALRCHNELMNSSFRGKYEREIREFAAELGDSFIGFAPHEQHGLMFDKNAEPYSDVSRYGREFTAKVKKIIDWERSIVPGASIWCTDPSFYSRCHLAAGADFPAAEFCISNLSVLAASTRGSAKAFGKPQWAAINSFECQAFGGLLMPPQYLQYYPDFEKKRGDLWRFTQFMLYLAGAKIIYSESGLFDHRFAPQREFDDYHLAVLRQTQRDLVAFARKYPLEGQPECDIGCIQGRFDVYNGNAANPWHYADRQKYSYLSWKNLEVFYPQAGCGPRITPAEQGMLRELASDAPYGEIDIVPAEAEPAALENYKLLVMCGWNTMDAEDFEKLHAYVYNGGILTIMLPQLTASSDLTAPVNAEYLKRFAGVSLMDGDAPLNLISLAAAAKNSFRHFRRALRFQPAYPHLKGPYYCSRIRQLEITGECCSVLAAEKNSQFPFLLANRCGKGTVYLFNLSDYPQHAVAHSLIGEALRDIAATVPRDIYLKSGKNISWFKYRNGSGYRIFALNNDWYGNRKSINAVFSVCGRDVPVVVRRNEVSVIEIPEDFD